MSTKFPRKTAMTTNHCTTMRRSLQELLAALAEHVVRILTCQDEQYDGPPGLKHEILRKLVYPNATWGRPDFNGVFFGHSTSQPLFVDACRACWEERRELRISNTVGCNGCGVEPTPSFHRPHKVVPKPYARDVTQLDRGLVYHWAQTLMGIHWWLEGLLDPTVWKKELQHCASLRRRFIQKRSDGSIHVDLRVLRHIVLNISTEPRDGGGCCRMLDTIADSWSLCSSCLNGKESRSVWSLGGRDCQECNMHIETDLETVIPGLPRQLAPRC